MPPSRQITTNHQPTRPTLSRTAEVPAVRMDQRNNSAPPTPAAAAAKRRCFAGIFLPPIERVQRQVECHERWMLKTQWRDIAPVSQLDRTAVDVRVCAGCVTTHSHQTSCSTITLRSQSTV